MSHKSLLVTPLVFLFLACGPSSESPPNRAADKPDTSTLRAGAIAVDITPTTLPCIVNGNFIQGEAKQVSDPLHARCLVLDDGQTRIAICIVDSCVLPGD